MLLKSLLKPIFVVCCIISSVSFFVNWLVPTFTWWYSFWPFAVITLLIIYIFVSDILLTIFTLIFDESHIE